MANQATRRIADIIAAYTTTALSFITGSRVASNTEKVAKYDGVTLTYVAAILGLADVTAMHPVFRFVRGLKKGDVRTASSPDSVTFIECSPALGLESFQAVLAAYAQALIDQGVVTADAINVALNDFGWMLGLRKESDDKGRFTTLRFELRTSVKAVSTADADLSLAIKHFASRAEYIGEMTGIRVRSEAETGASVSFEIDKVVKSMETRAKKYVDSLGEDTEVTTEDLMRQVLRALATKYPLLSAVGDLTKEMEASSN